MPSDPKIIAIIPARGGSKGIPRKNLVNFNGRPLVTHSILHGLNSKFIQRVIVSTEDDEIAEVSREHGAEVFPRDPELSRDTTLDIPVFQAVLEDLLEQGDLPDIVVHLRPTTPYREIEWIDAAIKLLQETESADSVRSVSAPVHHPYRVFRIDEEGLLDPLMKSEHPQPYLLRRQDLPPMYYYNCVIDVTRSATIMHKKSMTGDRILPYIMEPDDVIDIDSKRDLIIARCLFKENT